VWRHLRSGHSVWIQIEIRRQRRKKEKREESLEWVLRERQVRHGVLLIRFTDKVFLSSPFSGFIALPLRFFDTRPAAS
jgi:hypothetical protein